jgi:hypothetical protein
MQAGTSGTSKQSSGSDASLAASDEAGLSQRKRAMTAVRIGITTFVVVLLTIVALGWNWTSGHQPPPLRTASHVVLGIAGLAGILALAKIWWRDAPRVG